MVQTVQALSRKSLLYFDQSLKEIVLIQDRISLGLNTSVELPIRFKIDRPIHRKVDFLLGPGTGKLTGVIAGSQTNRIGSKFLNLRQR